MRTFSDPKVFPMDTRDGWLCHEAAGGGYIGWPGDSRPSIVAKHIDGPLLTFSDGQMHWLRPWERVQFYFGFTDAEKLERKLRPNLYSARPASDEVKG